MAEIASLATPFAAPGGRVIASPFQFTTDDDTYLRIVSANAVTGVQVAINGRRVGSDGQLYAINESHTPNTDRSTKTQDYKLGKGALLNLAIYASAGAPLIGQTYVQARIMQGTGLTAILLGVLLGGVVTASQAIGFPGSPVQSSLEVEPVIRNILGTGPGAGIAISETCPVGARWELVTVFTTLTTDATVGNRAVFFLAKSGVNPLSLTLGNASSDQGPGSAFDYTFGQNLTAGNTNGEVQICFPQRLFLRAGDSFVVSAFGKTAGDRFAQPQYQVREWQEVA